MSSESQKAFRIVFSCTQKDQQKEKRRKRLKKASPFGCVFSRVLKVSHLRFLHLTLSFPFSKTKKKQKKEKDELATRLCELASADFCLFQRGSAMGQRGHRGAQWFFFLFALFLIWFGSLLAAPRIGIWRPCGWRHCWWSSCRGIPR